MADLLHSLWAKKSRNDDLRWSPLTMHLQDCAGIAAHIWERWVSEGVKENIALHCRCSSDEAKQLFLFTAASHDVGKATPLFQAQAGFGNSQDLNERVLEGLRFSGLPMKRYDAFVNPRATPHALAGQLILERAGLPENIAVIIGSHHGNTPSSGDLTDNNIDSQPDNFHLEHTGALQWTTAQGCVVEYAKRIVEISDFGVLPCPDMEAQMLLTGLVIIADWIASNEEYFPLVSIDEPLSSNGSSLRSEMAFRAASFLRSRWRPDNAWTSESFFETRFAFHKNAVQAAAIDIASCAKVPGLLILEAPMGIGKTEAALAAAEIMACKTHRDGIFFALPTQVTSDGMFPRMLQWIDRLGDGNHTIELIHGKAQFNETFQSLRKLDGSADGIWDENDEGRTAFSAASISGWFTGRKRSILADFAVGTIDQLLQAALVQKHLMLRHVGLANKVVIIDECHAFDAYMNRYLERALLWLGAYSVPVVMLSATLPSQKRDAMLNAYHYVRRQGLFQSTVSGYPLITCTDEGKISQFSVFTDAETTRVYIHPIEESFIAGLLDMLLVGGGCAGVIVNTVGRAQSIAGVLRGHFGDCVRLIHSRLISTDRLTRERDLIRELGKPGPDAERPEMRIVVGTQVLEQSIDIDFDVLISDLCPMDLLLQRIGRLHRHTRARPATMAEACCYVVDAGSDRFEPGSAAIYGDYLLMRTNALLPKFISIPSDISTLVELTYGNDDGIFTELPSGYEGAKAAWKKRTEIKEGKAGAFLLRRPTADDTIENLLCMMRNSDADADAKVRDIDESIEVNVVRMVGDTLTLFSDDGIILSRDVPDDDTARRIARDCLRLPAVLCRGSAAGRLIDEIELFDTEHFPLWQRSTWLRGSLILPFDENDTAVLMGYRLHYDAFLGLKYEKEGEVNG